MDESEPMPARLREKSDAVRAEVGDFRLVYLVFNTVMNVTTQAAQVAAFRTAAAHLVPGGHFVVEVGVPALQRLPLGETVRAFALTDEHLGFDECDVVDQRMWSHHYRLTEGRPQRFSVPFRYVWPAELDLTAQPAGLRRRHRWADWSRAPFTAESTSHVSVWQLSPS